MRYPVLRESVKAAKTRRNISGNVVVTQTLSGFEKAVSFNTLIKSLEYQDERKNEPVGQDHFRRGRRTR